MYAILILPFRPIAVIHPLQYEGRAEIVLGGGTNPPAQHRARFIEGVRRQPHLHDPRERFAR
jgi:hypothetical protein